jgi:hypothetical protein
MNTGRSNGYELPNIVYMSSGVAKTVFEGYISDGVPVGGIIDYTVQVYNTTGDQQVQSGSVRFNCTRAGTTYVKGYPDATPAGDFLYTESTGSLTLTDAWYMYAGDGVIAVQPTFTSNMTGTVTMKLNYFVRSTPIVKY